MIAPSRPSRWRLLLTPVGVAVGIGVSWLIFLSLTPRDTDQFALNRAFLQDSFIRHVELVAVSFAVATAVGLPVGILLARSGRWLGLPVFGVANLGQAIPSIGVLVFFYEVFGLGFRPAVIALVLYSLLPILRNTMVGVRGVDPAAIESARGMGMTGVQSLLRVELPLASPVIFAGLRTSLVLIVGTATLGNFISAGGLGDVIASGINQSDRIVLVGAVMVAVLALMADWTLGLVERVVTPHV